MVDVALKFCPYCRTQRPASEFTQIKDSRGYKRLWKCNICLSKRKPSAAERDALAGRNRDRTREAESNRAREILDERARQARENR